MKSLGFLLRRLGFVSLASSPVVLFIALSLFSTASAGCNFSGTLSVEAPYCPTSDGKYVEKDSVSAFCCASDSALKAGKVARAAWCLRDTVLNQSVMFAFDPQSPGRCGLYVQDPSRDPFGLWYYKAKSEERRSPYISEVRDRLWFRERAR